MFSYHFDVMISKIILMYFEMKNTLKNNCYHTLKHASFQWIAVVRRLYIEEKKFSFFMNTIKIKKKKCILYICLAILLKNNF